MTHQTNPDVTAQRNDTADELATAPLTPPTQPAASVNQSVDQHPLDLDPWTPERRAEWQTWLADKLLATGYAAQRVDGRRTFYLTELARRSGIAANTLLSWLQRGSQPSYAHVTPLARALGVMSIVVAYQAGLVSRADVIPLLSELAIPTVESLHTLLASIATLQDAPLRHTLERQTQHSLLVVETLQRELGWTDADFGPVAAEVAIRELADDPTPVDEHVPYGDPGDTPRQPVIPGPTARYQATYDERGDEW